MLILLSLVCFRYTLSQPLPPQALFVFLSRCGFVSRLCLSVSLSLSLSLSVCLSLSVYLSFGLSLSLSLLRKSIVSQSQSHFLCCETVPLSLSTIFICNINICWFDCITYSSITYCLVNECLTGTWCLLANIMKDTPTGHPSIPSTGIPWMWDLTEILWVGFMMSGIYYKLSFWNTPC